MAKNKFNLYLNEFVKNQYTLVVEENLQALLRGVPLLQLYNINQFTYPFGWRVGKKNNLEILKHNYEHINDVKLEVEKRNTNPFCMITTSYYDKIDEYTLMSVINSTNRKMVIVLKNEDVINDNKLKSFIRPIKETNLIFSNFSIDYNTLFNDTINYLVDKCGFKIQLPNSMNLYLQYLAFITCKIFDTNVKRTYDFINYLLDDSFNPLYFSIVKILNEAKYNNLSKIIDKICKIFGYYFELSTYELKKISDKIRSNYYENKFELNYWLENNNKNKKLIKKIIKLNDTLKEPVRSRLLFHWNMIINHFY